MDLLALVSAVVSAVMTIVVFIALLRLFSIDASLKDIRNHLLRTGATPVQVVARGAGKRTAFRVVFIVLMCAVVALVIVAVAAARH
jgi:hypothetical protein